MPSGKLGLGHKGVYDRVAVAPPVPAPLGVHGKKGRGLCLGVENYEIVGLSHLVIAAHGDVRSANLGKILLTAVKTHM